MFNASQVKGYVSVRKLANRFMVELQVKSADSDWSSNSRHNVHC